MSDNIIDFADRGAIEQEAGEWLIRLDSEEPLTRHERAQLREWCGRSAAHRKELADLARFWGKMNILTELAVPLGKADETPGRRVAAKVTGLLGSARRAGALAAVLVVGVVAGLGYWSINDPLLDTNGVYASAVGQQQTVTLADGSVIQLNTDSRLEVNFNNQARTINLLRGEAFFTVAKNAERPFMVYAGNGLVKAVGTAFSVYLKNSDINVAVTEGRVALASVKGPAEKGKPAEDANLNQRKPPPPEIERDLGTLDAGQVAVIKVSAMPDPIVRPTASINPGEEQQATSPQVELVHTPDKQQLQRQLAWRNGLLIFAGDDLEQVVDEISRYTTLKIEITDPALKAIKIGGQFRVGDTHGMFESLEANFGLQVNRVSANHVQLALAE